MAQAIKYKERVGNTDIFKEVEYKNKVVPIKQKDGKYKPNYAERWKAAMMFDSDFEKYQRSGKTILVNFYGGWCILTKDMVEVK